MLKLGFTINPDLADACPNWNPELAIDQSQSTGKRPIS